MCTDPMRPKQSPTPAGTITSPAQGQADTTDGAQTQLQEKELFWRLLRGPSKVRDQILTPLAHAWYGALPADLQPLALRERYPRVANRLALCWADPVLTDVVLRELLNDKRRRRKGFAGDVRLELLKLHAASIEGANPG
jgi:hypothetical protein